ncbi:hypothetical protein FNF28_00950 [Cafeteria roenbergensis]|uniref:CMP/dCMP-type deaminase domain-containing protein n=1 Tax=Cafeteria roenbergensis TaxID=33653 RepID=A0A5A8E2J4_CAFRO|nr:hypothetical protein FNF28_00950 [Cafeteria roenbergensis]
MDAAGHAHASSIEAENDLAGRKRRTPQFDEIIWEPGALPLSRRLMTCIGVDVEPKATGLAVGACRGSRNVQEGMRHLKRVSSLEAQADYKSKLPTGTTPSADIMALAEGPCRIPEGKIRILVGPAAAFPDDLPPHSHCVGAGPQAVKRAEPLDESTVPSGIRTLVERGRADFPLHLYNLPPLPLPAGTDEPPVAHVDQYICTGYDVYLSVEPCAMDAMALSHARVRSVVFAARDPIDGALLSRLRLHEARPLNHHYSVFQMREDSELAKEAASLWDEGDEIGVGDPFSSRLPKAGVRAGSSP